MSLLEKTRNWYSRFERPISSISLISGFVFDALTLKRVDTLWENVWVLVHLIVVAIFIILIHYKENNPGDEKNPGKAHFWYVNILQFFFGGILSTYLVFYFRSTDIWTTWPFLLVLTLAFIANESLKRHYIRLSFQITLFFLSIYSFTIFLLPVMMHRIGTFVFILSGILSLVIIELFILTLFNLTKDRLKESKSLTVSLIIGIFGLVNLLYFTNLIPPIPLSLKDAGVYYSVERNNNGNYNVVYAKDNNFLDYFKLYPVFEKKLNSKVYIYSAIFSPNNLDLTIVHQWQFYNENIKKWETRETVNLPVVGGRDGGFRTYSLKSSLEEGKWRVNIETEQGQIIGRLRFRLVKTNFLPTLSTKTKK